MVARPRRFAPTGLQGHRIGEGSLRIRRRPTQRKDRAASDRRGRGLRQTREAITELDLRGLKCPLPALRTAKRLRTLRPGERLAVLTSDPLAPLDIAHLCRERGDALLASEALPDGGNRFLIRRGDGSDQKV